MLGIEMIPKTGQVFELSMDSPRSPVRMMLDCGISDEYLSYEGPEIAGPTTQKFTLEMLGGQSRERIAEQASGPLAHGQWMQAFLATYPNPAGCRFRVAFGSFLSNWMYWEYEELPFSTFPVLEAVSSSWRPFLQNTEQVFHEGLWLWLVEV